MKNLLTKGKRINTPQKDVFMVMGSFWLSTFELISY